LGQEAAASRQRLDLPETFWFPLEDGASRTAQNKAASRNLGCVEQSSID